MVVPGNGAGGVRGVLLAGDTSSPWLAAAEQRTSVISLAGKLNCVHQRPRATWELKSTAEQTGFPAQEKKNHILMVIEGHKFVRSTGGSAWKQRSPCQSVPREPFASSRVKWCSFERWTEELDHSCTKDALLSLEHRWHAECRSHPLTHGRGVSLQDGRGGAPMACRACSVEAKQQSWAHTGQHQQ